jgi:hypothetical protein
MKNDSFLREENYPNLEYNRIYLVSEKPMVYIGNDLNGRGRLLLKEGFNPVIYSFDIRESKINGEELKTGKLSSLLISDKEKSFVLEILTKKGL